MEISEGVRCLTDVSSAMVDSPYKSTLDLVWPPHYISSVVVVVPAHISVAARISVGHISVGHISAAAPAVDMLIAVFSDYTIFIAMPSSPCIVFSIFNTAPSPSNTSHCKDHSCISLGFDSYLPGTLTNSGLSLMDTYLFSQPIQLSLVHSIAFLYSFDSPQPDLSTLSPCLLILFHTFSVHFPIFSWPYLIIYLVVHAALSISIGEPDNAVQVQIQGTMKEGFQAMTANAHYGFSYYYYCPPCVLSHSQHLLNRCALTLSSFSSPYHGSSLGLDLSLFFVTPLISNHCPDPWLYQCNSQFSISLAIFSSIAISF